VGRRGGRAPGQHADEDDAEVRLHNERLRAATGVGPGDRVLDMGCGTGQTTRDAARAAVSGTVLGVDLSASMLARARRLTEDEGLHNVGYLQADAQVHPFPVAHFDVGISRFGAMFFADPVAAFANIGRALCPGARLVLMVWQDRDRNEWASAVREALAAGRVVPDPPAGGPHPFSLADPATVERILDAAGYAEVRFADVHEPVYYGRDTAAAFDFVRGLSSVKALLAGLDAAEKERALDRLRSTITAHDAGRGVLFDSRAWIVTAHRR
jgi:SAM-dependent methyltransferase